MRGEDPTRGEIAEHVVVEQAGNLAAAVDVAAAHRPVVLVVVVLEHGVGVPEQLVTGRKREHVVLVEVLDEVGALPLRPAEVGSVRPEVSSRLACPMSEMNIRPVPP